jgi:hypothetical protein
MNPPDHAEESGPPAPTSGALEEGRPRTAHSSQSEIPDATGSQKEARAPVPSPISAPGEPVPTEGQSTGQESSSEASSSDQAIATVPIGPGSDMVDQTTDIRPVVETTKAGEMAPVVVANTTAEPGDEARQRDPASAEKRPAEETQNPLVDERGIRATNIGQIRLEPKWKQHVYYLVMVISTMGWVAFTVAYAFLSSSPQHTLFSFPHSQNSIILLTLFANLTVFFLVQCFSGVCDKLRWALAVRESGVDMSTFLSLSGGTTPAGLVRLLFSRKRTWRCRLWCFGRFDPL